MIDVQNRMVDFGIDAPWLSHEPWVVPEPFTPEAGEMWSKEDIDYWIDVLAHVCDEAYADPEIVRTAPHNQAIHKLDRRGARRPGRLGDDLARAQRKAAERAAAAAPALVSDAAPQRPGRTRDRRRTRARCRDQPSFRRRAEPSARWSTSGRPRRRPDGSP